MSRARAVSIHQAAELFGAQAGLEIGRGDTEAGEIFLQADRGDSSSASSFTSRRMLVSRKAMPHFFGLSGRTSERGVSRRCGWW